MAEANGSDDGAAADGPPTAPSGNTELPPSDRVGTFASPGIRNFRYLWLGQPSHAGALWVEQTAPPFLLRAVAGVPPPHSTVSFRPERSFGKGAAVSAGD